MSTTYKAPANRPKRAPSPFTKLEINIPTKTFEMLREISLDRQIPMSILISIAIDNELDVPTPFNYPCPEPTTPFIEHAYAEEGGKIYRFLRPFKGGVDLESLMLCRRDIGINSREMLMLGLREVLKATLVEAFRPSRTVFQYPKGYVRYRLKPDDPRDLKKAVRKQERLNNGSNQEIYEEEDGEES